VLNHDGFPLSGTLQNEGSGLQLSPKVSFPNSHPDLWNRIMETPSGNYESPKGVWVWKSILPADTIRSIAKTLSPKETIQRRMHSEGLRLSLVAFTPSSALIPLFREIRMPAMFVVIFVLVVYGTSLYFYLRGTAMERRAELSTAVAMTRTASMERLKEAEERFRRVFEASSTGMIVVNEAGLIELSNRAAETLLGFDKDEFVGLSVDDLLPIGKREEHGSLRQKFLRAPETRKMGIGRELEAVAKDGRKKAVEVGLNPYLEQGQQLVLATIVELSSKSRRTG